MLAAACNYLHLRSIKLTYIYDQFKRDFVYVPISGECQQGALCYACNVIYAWKYTAYSALAPV